MCSSDVGVWPTSNRSVYLDFLINAFLLHNVWKWQSARIMCLENLDVTCILYTCSADIMFKLRLPVLTCSVMSLVVLSMSMQCMEHACTYMCMYITWCQPYCLFMLGINKKRIRLNQCFVSMIKIWNTSSRYVEVNHICYTKLILKETAELNITIYVHVHVFFYDCLPTPFILSC